MNGDFSSTLIVLTGGKGERIRSVTNGMPKHMILVDGQPLFCSALVQLVEDFHVERAAFRLAYNADSFIKKWQQGEYQTTVPSTLIVGCETDGPIGALVSSCRFLRGSTFVVVAGDVYFGVGTFSSMLRFHLSGKNGMTVGIARATPTRRPSTLTIDEDGVLTSFCRKELTTTEDFINAGLYIVDRDRVDWLVADYDRHCQSLGDTVEYKEDQLWQLTLKRRDRARFFPLPGRIVNVNSPQDLKHAEALARR